jgi:hypothetical protein
VVGMIDTLDAIKIVTEAPSPKHQFPLSLPVARRGFGRTSPVGHIVAAQRRRPNWLEAVPFAALVDTHGRALRSWRRHDAVDGREGTSCL